MDKTEVVFDEIRFLESVTRTIAIANTGQVLLTLIKQFYNRTVFLSLEDDSVNKTVNDKKVLKLQKSF